MESPEEFQFRNDLMMKVAQKSPLLAMLLGECSCSYQKSEGNTRSITLQTPSPLVSQLLNELYAKDISQDNASKIEPCVLKIDHSIE